MPHKIRWDNLKAKEDLVLKMPWDVREELTKVTNGLAALDVTADNFELGQHGVAVHQLGNMSINTHAWWHASARDMLQPF